ncbi:TDP-N-acetylfucosamine:lipid II N-acetylfucosaminyltransferase [Sulfurimonas sp. HSL-1656]|uniref:TDP-N-acetylfucosamine:lipid II N-acetylfucosaminyltransferase n=1 Tax=Thiomicrolovo subterrani TaxID=3131934 RepID=UPI0031F8E51D
MKYLHIMKNEKFIASFIDFIDTRFDADEHQFIVLGGLSEQKHPLPKHPNVLVFKKMNNPLRYLQTSKQLKPYFDRAEKVIVHSLLIRGIVDFFFHNLRYCAKAYWVIWGGDLYDYPAKRKQLKRQFYLYKKKQVIRRFAGLVTYVDGDVDLAREWYGATGKHFECLIYKSNIYSSVPVQSAAPKKEACIQVGNSATASNHHLEIFDRLACFARENIRVVCPLSYGNRNYRDRVMARGRELFGDKFEPLVEFMPFEEYLQLLSEIDIAVFNHKRQQGMGNIITLLGLGKKVHLRRDVATWSLFEALGIKVFDAAEIDLQPMDAETKAENETKVKAYFSEANLKQQLEELFKG